MTHHQLVVVNPKPSMDQASPPSRSLSEPPRYPGYISGTMQTDPSGLYKGDNYDPRQLEKKFKPRGLYTEPGTPRRYQTTPTSGPRSGTNDTTVTRDRCATQQVSPASNHQGTNGSTNGHNNQSGRTSRAREYGYDGRGGFRRKSPRSPSPIRTAGPILTGFASHNTAPVKPKPASDFWSSTSSDRWASIASVNNMTSSVSYHTAPDSLSREDGEILSSPAVPPAASASVTKVHPSRLGRVPQAPSTLNPQSPPRIETFTKPVDQTSSASRFTEPPINERLNAVRPAALDLTLAGAAHVAQGLATPSTATTEHRPSSISYSPVNKSPLDSLEKLRKFREQVVLSRKSASIAESSRKIDLSKLAKMAETFLRADIGEERESSFEQLEQLTGAGKCSAAEKADNRGNGASARHGGTKSQSKQNATPANPDDTLRTAASTQAELKERLLTLKKGEDASPSLQDGTKTPAGIQGQPLESPISRTKREREDSDLARQEAEQKRRRAEAWAQHSLAPAASDKRDTRRQPLDDREEGEIDRYESSRDPRRHSSRGRRVPDHDRVHDRMAEGSRARDTSGSMTSAMGPSLIHDSIDSTCAEGYGDPGPVTNGQRDRGRVPPPRAASGDFGPRQSGVKTGYAPKLQYSYEGTSTMPAISTEIRHGRELVSATPASTAERDAAYEARRRARTAAVQEQEYAVRTERGGSTRPLDQRERSISHNNGERGGYRARYVRVPVSRHEAYDPHERLPLDCHGSVPRLHADPPPPGPPSRPELDTAVVLAAIAHLENQVANLKAMITTEGDRAVTPAPPVLVPVPEHEHGRTYEHQAYLGPRPLASRARRFHSMTRTASPPQRGYAPSPPPPVKYPIRDLHSRISSPIAARHERGGPYKTEAGGYKGRNGYHANTERGRGRRRGGDHHHSRGGHHTAGGHGYGPGHSHDHGHGHGYDKRNDHGYGNDRGSGGGGRGRGGQHRGGERGGRGKGRGRGGPPR